MGLLDKVRKLTGSPSKQLLQTGLPGRGTVVGIKETAVTMGGVSGEDAFGNTTTSGGKQVCEFTLDIELEGRDRYRATCRQQLPNWITIAPGATVVAVRVDPADPAAVAIDWGSTPKPG